MNIEKLEDVVDNEVIEDDDVEIEIDDIELVFQSAEAMRQRIVEAFREECSVDDVFIAAGGVKQRAYWGWESVVYAKGVAIGCAIELMFEDDTCEFSVSTSRAVSETQVEQISATGSCPLGDGPAHAFIAFRGLLEEFANEA